MNGISVSIKITIQIALEKFVV